MRGALGGEHVKHAFGLYTIVIITRIMINAICMRKILE